MLFTPEEVREFLDAHIPHRLTALLSTIERQRIPTFFQGKDDVYRSAIEGTYIMTRVFIEFLGVQSAKTSSGLRLVQRARVKADDSKKVRETDVMLDCFGLPLASPADFDPHQDLIARVHDGLSKSTAHFTYKTDSFFDAGRDLLPAIDVIMSVLHSRFYSPLNETPKVSPDLPLKR